MMKGIPPTTDGEISFTRVVSEQVQFAPKIDMNKTLKSDFLVASPSFASGVGRLLDWNGLYDTYNESSNGREADAKAMYADWRMVGQDILDAMVEFEASPTVK